MSERPTKLIVDCSLPEGHPNKVQIIPLTDEEIAQREADAAQAAIKQTQREQEALEKQQNKESAKSKLSALGLTENEIQALLG
jgi:hypothetical protein